MKIIPGADGGGPRSAYRQGMSSLQRSRSGRPGRISSGLAIADNALLVLGVIVVAVVLLNVLGAVAGFVFGGLWFLIKLAAVAAAVYVAVRLAMRASRRG